MNLRALLKGIEIPSPIPSIEIKGINYDSRKVEPGDLFVAVKGTSSDGHKFLKDVEAHGAVAAIVERANKSLTIPQVMVENSRTTLAQVSNIWFEYPSKAMTLIGVTGTNGKTTTTYILESIAKESGKNPGVIGTINYRYGGKLFPSSHTTPESLDLQMLLKKMLKSGVDFVIMEVSSHALELKRVNGVDFDVAIFTNLTQDHLDFHKSLENYFESKALFFTNVIKDSNKEKKFAIINIDDPRGAALRKRTEVPTITFGISQNSKPDLTLREFKFNHSGLKGNFEGLLTGIFHSSLVGMHNAYNILGAAACSYAVGIESNDIINGISKLTGVPGRLEKVSREGKNDPLILVDYAHTDDALRNVLSAIQALPHTGKVITVFGCGGDRDNKKRPLMGKAAICSSDIVIVTSDNPRTEEPQKIIDEILKGILETGAKEISKNKSNGGFMVEPDRRKAIHLAIELASPNDIILIAGKGHEDYQIIGREKVHFDDREVALEALNKKGL